MQNFFNMCSYFWQKLFLAAPLCIVTVKEDDYLVLFCLIMIVIVDTLLGVTVAIKFKRFSASKLRGLMGKISVYALSLMTFWILHCADPVLFGWTFRYFTVFLILTEVFSNIEKLSLLGLNVPTKIMSKISDEFKQYYESTASKRAAAINKILDREKPCPKP